MIEIKMDTLQAEIERLRREIQALHETEDEGKQKLTEADQELSALKENIRQESRSFSELQAQSNRIENDVQSLSERLVLKMNGAMETNTTSCKHTR